MFRIYAIGQSILVNGEDKNATLLALWGFGIDAVAVKVA